MYKSFIVDIIDNLMYNVFRLSQHNWGVNVFRLFQFHWGVICVSPFQSHWEVKYVY